MNLEMSLLTRGPHKYKEMRYRRWGSIVQVEKKLFRCQQKLF